MGIRQTLKSVFERLTAQRDEDKLQQLKNLAGRRFRLARKVLYRSKPSMAYDPRFIALIRDIIGKADGYGIDKLTAIELNNEEDGSDFGAGYAQFIDWLLVMAKFYNVEPELFIDETIPDKIFELTVRKQYAKIGTGNTTPPDDGAPQREIHITLKKDYGAQHILEFKEFENTRILFVLNFAKQWAGAQDSASITADKIIHIKWTLVDEKVKHQWKQIPNEKKRNLTALIHSGTEMIEVLNTDQNKRLKEIKIYDGIVFYLFHSEWNEILEISEKTNMSIGGDNAMLAEPTPDLGRFLR